MLIHIRPTRVNWYPKKNNKKQKTKTNSWNSFAKINLNISYLDSDLGTSFVIEKKKSANPTYAVSCLWILSKYKNTCKFSLTHYQPLFHFYSPVKTSENLMFSGGIEVEDWLKILKILECFPYNFNLHTYKKLLNICRASSDAREFAKLMNEQYTAAHAAHFICNKVLSINPKHKYLFKVTNTDISTTSMVIAF